MFNPVGAHNNIYITTNNLPVNEAGVVMNKHVIMFFLALWISLIVVLVWIQEEKDQSPVTTNKITGMVIAEPEVGITSCATIIQPGHYFISSDINVTSNATCIEINASNVILDGNNHTIKGSGGENSVGIFINNAMNVSILSINFISLYEGIKIENSTNILISSSFFSNITLAGIFARNISNANITDASIEHAGHGAYFMSAGGLLVERSKFTNCGYSGVSFVSSNESVIEENYFDNNSLSIYLDSSRNMSLSSNVLRVYSGQAGIWLTGGSTYNLIYMNNITSAGGELLKISQPEDANNMVYLNNFYQENNTISSLGTNTAWNSSVILNYTYNGSSFQGFMGNYWSNHNLTDGDGDGIADLSYLVDEDDVDYHPLVLPYECYFGGCGINETLTVSIYNISECMIIASPGVYSLSIDLTTSENSCIEVRSDNVMIDGDGYEIASVSGGIGGIWVENTSNLTISNLILKGWKTGIHLKNISQVSLQGLVLKDGSRGLDIRNCNDVDIDNVSLYNHVYEAGLLSYVKKVQMNDVLVRNSNTGLFIEFGDNIDASSVTIEDHNSMGIYMRESTDSVIDDLSLQTGENYALYLEGCKKLTLNGVECLSNYHGCAYIYNSNEVKLYSMKLESATLPFVYGDNFMINASTIPSTLPSGWASLGTSVEIKILKTNEWVSVNMSYTDASVPEKMRNTVSLWRYDGVWHSPAEGWASVIGTNTQQKYVYANITSFSIFVPLWKNDTSPPNITTVILSPKNISVNSTLNITVIVEDETGIKNVLFEQDNVNHSYDGRANNTFWWLGANTSIAGNFSVVVWVEDPAGNWNHEAISYQVARETKESLIPPEFNSEGMELIFSWSSKIANQSMIDIPISTNASDITNIRIVAKETLNNLSIYVGKYTNPDRCYVSDLSGELPYSCYLIHIGEMLPDNIDYLLLTLKVGNEWVSSNNVSNIAVYYTETNKQAWREADVIKLSVDTNTYTAQLLNLTYLYLNVSVVGKTERPAEAVESGVTGITQSSCGNGVCDENENCSSCPQDCGQCGSICGNGICEMNESISCPQDCEEKKKSLALWKYLVVALLLGTFASIILFRDRWMSMLSKETLPLNLRVKYRENELEKYIMNAMKQGIPAGQIYASLLRVGWDEGRINTAFALAKIPYSQKNKLYRYILLQLKRGMNPNKLEKLVIARGWDPSVVRYMIEKVMKDWRIS